MGLFLALSAVRTEDTDGVADAVVRYARSHGVEAAVAGADGRSASSRADEQPEATEGEARVVPAGAGWSVLFWPDYFNGLGPASQWLSAELDVLTSAIDVYDGDLWNHLLFRRGVLIDRFSSIPDYFTRNRGEKARLRREWAGKPGTVGEAFGVPPDRIERYLIHTYTSFLFGRAARNSRVNPDDVFDLGDVWVFVDFWRHLGIRYPDPDHGRVAGEVGIRFVDGPSALPTGGSEFSL